MKKIVTILIVFVLFCSASIQSLGVDEGGLKKDLLKIIPQGHRLAFLAYMQDLESHGLYYVLEPETDEEFEFLLVVLQRDETCKLIIYEISDSGLTVLWESVEVLGYISDVNLIDVDKDGSKEIVLTTYYSKHRRL